MFRAHVGEREKNQIKHLLEQDSMSLQWNVQIHLLGMMEPNGLQSMLWGNHILSHKILYYSRCVNTCTLRNMCTKLLSRAGNRKCLPISTVCRGNRIQTRNSSLASMGLWHSPGHAKGNDWELAGLNFQYASDTPIPLQAGSHHGVSFPPSPGMKAGFLFFLF